MGRPSFRVRDEPAPNWELIADGVHARVMVEAQGSTIILYKLDRGRRFERHEHASAELVVVLYGGGRSLMGEEERTLRGGDSLCIPAGLPHGFVVDEHGPAVLLNVTVPRVPELELPEEPSDAVLRVGKRVAGSRG
ncbi:MAG: cupin domain-containing protein [Thermoplasmata archaeon]